MKADGLDHHAAHDLIGCQDIAWDIVGAAVELDLSEGETEEVAQIVASAAGHPVDPGLRSDLHPCYIAFQLGAATLAADAVDGDERSRLLAAAERYKERLAAFLGSRVSGADCRWATGQPLAAAAAHECPTAMPS